MDDIKHRIAALKSANEGILISIEEIKEEAMSGKSESPQQVMELLEELEEHFNIDWEAVFLLLEAIEIIWRNIALYGE